MKTTEVNKELIGRRCECIFTGLMVTGVIEDTEENEHTIEVMPSRQIWKKWFQAPISSQLCCFVSSFSRSHVFILLPW